MVNTDRRLFGHYGGSAATVARRCLSVENTVAFFVTPDLGLENRAVETDEQRRPFEGILGESARAGNARAAVRTNEVAQSPASGARQNDAIIGAFRQIFLVQWVVLA